MCKNKSSNRSEEKGVIMDKKESLSILSSVCKQMEAMSASQLFDYMMKNSDTFRTHVGSLQNMIELLRKGCFFFRC